MTIPTLCVFFLVLSLSPAAIFALKKPYIVYMGSHKHGINPTDADIESVKNSHYNLLGSYLGSTETAQESIFYSYTRNINGFAAMLDEHEVEQIKKNPNVVSVFRNKGRKLHTTRSWEFLHVERDGHVPSKSIWNKARFGEDTIIGNIDSGVWPESESFNDEGLGPIPSRWLGACQSGDATFRCNKKLIGARFFNKGYNKAAGNLTTFFSARDTEGHGTHTLSTAGASFVAGASVFNNGRGTAKGGAPKARVAAYKVCGPPIINECFDSDILAGFDAAISDGVDVLSASIAGKAEEFSVDSIAIGSFHAVMRGITVVASAGNTGPSPGTVSNVAPWLLTVGASTVDRQFRSDVSLGQNNHFKGASLSNTSLPEKKFYPLIRGADAKMKGADVLLADMCVNNTIDPAKVKGKILLCIRGEIGSVEKGYWAANAGAVGMIVANEESNENVLASDLYTLPASSITYADGQAVYNYLNTTKKPKAYITPVKTELGTKPAPQMADFSARGPNTIYADILKPDVTAPGVDIIAAYSEVANPSGELIDNRTIRFNTMSGTSMSCPHVAGLAALLKTLYPNWSPAAIKSAIMTTARIRDNNAGHILDYTLEKASPFAYGSGHIRPNRAMDPGLVYDMTETDYLNIFCAIGYNIDQIRQFTNKTFECIEGFKLYNLNYPTITLPNLDGPTTVVRRVKNVGPPATYRAHVRAPPGVSVSVRPDVLEFTEAVTEHKFEVVFKKTVADVSSEYDFGELVWSDGKHIVKSTLSVRFHI